MKKIDLIMERMEKLENARHQLKKHFVCLDETIDKILDAIKLWYIDPSLLERAPIVCMWGPTGVGKSDLVKKLIDLLELNNTFFHLSMNASEEMSSISSFQRLLFEKTEPSASHNVVFLDEFQWFNTRDPEGNNIKSKNLNDIWDFLAEREIRKEVISRDIQDIYKLAVYHRLFGNRWGVGGLSLNKHTTLKKAIEEQKKTMVFTGQLLSNNELEFVKKKMFPEISLRDLSVMNIDAFVDLLEEKMECQDLWKNTVCRNYLIFIAGNLDNAYKFCGSTNYDIDADYFHSLSTKINISDIKRCLQESFRDEHISRLGNTNIIFPTINKFGYEQIISRYCKLHIDAISKKHGVKVQISSSVYTMLYKNSVYPTQGTRPVFATINDFFNNVIGTLVLEAILRKNKTLKIEYDYDKYVVIGTYNKSVIRIPFIGDIDRVKLKESKKIGEKLIHAAHEAGHCLVYSLLYNTVPNKVVVSTSTEYGGFVFDAIDKVTLKQYEKDIMVCYAGIEAEKVIFGDNNISTGSSSDVDKATRHLAFIVRNSGIINSAKITNPTNEKAASLHTGIEVTNKIIAKMAEKYRKECKSFLVTHKAVLVDLTDLLFKSSILDGNQLQTFFREHGFDFEIKPYLIEEDSIPDQEFIHAFERLKNQVKKGDKDARRTDGQ